MRKGRHRRSAKVVPMKGDSKRTENKPLTKEKKRTCPPLVDFTSKDWSDKVTHPAVRTVLTLLFTGLLICLMVLVCSIAWTVSQRVEKPSTSTDAFISTAAATTSEETSTVDRSSKALGSTISLREKVVAAQRLSAKQGMSSTCGGNNRCSINSQCIDGVDASTCICDMGYYGGYCDAALLDCERLICNSHGECRSRVDTKQIYCSCTDAYTGDNCEVEPAVTSTPCSNLTTPCSGNGQCIDLSEEDYICTCNSGYNGVDCEVNINDCGSTPCYHGNCTDLVNGFSCDCELGYEGVQCQTVTNLHSCSVNPCPTHSTCIDLVNNYTCLCDVGHVGVDCHSLCDDEPCFNNATCSLCEWGSCNGTGLPFRCNCTDNGTYGLLCTDRDGFWTSWSDWMSVPDWSLGHIETPTLSLPVANCTYLNTTRTRSCVEPVSAGAQCDGASVEEAELTDEDIECECLICCEGSLPCEAYPITVCECNEQCDVASFRCCNNSTSVCASTPVITLADLT